MSLPVWEKDTKHQNTMLLHIDPKKKFDIALINLDIHQEKK